MTLAAALKWNHKRSKERAKILSVTASEIKEVKKNRPDINVSYKGRRYMCRCTDGGKDRAGLVPYQEIGKPTNYVPLLGTVFHETWETVTRAYIHGVTIDCSI